jgi:hypothetical protein
LIDPLADDRSVVWLVGLVGSIEGKGAEEEGVQQSRFSSCGRSTALPAWGYVYSLTNHAQPINHTSYAIRSFSRALSASELAEWHAEHSWRTKLFMIADHMFYSHGAMSAVRSPTNAKERGGDVYV